MNRHDYESIASRLTWYAEVPDDVLAEVVTRDGLCFWAFDRGDMPALLGSIETDPDRELAAEMCAGCGVVDECLELELRSAGEDTLGVWGAMCDSDRRELHRVWQVRHINRRTRGGDSK